MDSPNPYQPPSSQLKQKSGEFGGEQEAYFFTASPLKFNLLSFASFGLYPLYWFYQNWKLIKQRENTTIMPFWRAFFAPLWAYTCFQRIQTAATEQRLGGLSIVALALLYFLLNACSSLPPPYSVTALFSFVPVAFANALALKINAARTPAAELNSSFSAANIALLVLGGVLALLSLLGFLLIFLGVAQPVE